jgi:hypothetical protein
MGRGAAGIAVLPVTAALLVPAAGAAAAPSPRPVAGRTAAPRDASRADGGHSAGHGRGRAHHRPRAVVRCQNDETDQVDEFDSDDDEPRHVIGPGRPAPYGHCPGYRDALALAGLLGTGGRPGRTVRR